MLLFYITAQNCGLW